MSNSWYTIKASGENPNKTVEVFVYDDIGFFGITAKDFIDSIRALPAASALNVRINSLGGSVFDAVAIFNFLRNRGNVETTVDGVAASAASVIAMAGSKRTMGEGSFLMVHNPWNYAAGDAAELRDQADVLDKIAGSLAAIYSKATGIAEDAIRKLMDSESWIDGKTAKADGWVTNLADAPAAQARISANRFRSTPKALVQASAPSELEVDDDVTWTEGGKSSFGSIIEIERDGVLALPDIGISATGTPENPAALIELYAEVMGSDGMATGSYVCTDKRTVLNFSELTAATDLTVLSESDSQSHTMKKILNALATAGLVSSPELSDDAAVTEISAKASALAGVQSKLTTAEKDLAAARALYADTVVSAAVADGRIKADAKDPWVAKITSDPKDAALLASITPKPHGGSAMNHSHGSGTGSKAKTLTEQCIEANKANA